MTNISLAYAKILEVFLAQYGDKLPKYHQYFLALLKKEQQHPQDEKDTLKNFIAHCVQAVSEELNCLPPQKKKSLLSLAKLLENKGFKDVFYEKKSEARMLLWDIFSKEALDLLNTSPENIIANSDILIQKLRQNRSIQITNMNPHPIFDPASQILFTSNILLSPPIVDDISKLDIPEHIKKKVIDISKNEKQLYWYDHPMPIGVKPEANEMLYGLHGLSEMLKFEKKEGTVDADTRINIVLSVSVTHDGLAEIAQEYLQYELDKAGDFEGLDIYIITETSSKEISDILNTLHKENHDVSEVFGVNGRYGRHYSFLKAIAAVWHLSIDKKIKATFKIDLDQVFDQERIKAETGKTTLQHFMTPLWGAEAIDSDGDSIELGMIAGALVNESDISEGLFTPDVPLPSEPLAPIDILFPRNITMALSTRAEMMTKYQENTLEYPDGIKNALHRIHVTGGTNGILVDTLRKHQPFTPSFIGRAEDQAYLMSIYNRPIDRKKLRYAHASGLIMRHDKAAFAGDAIKAAKLGTYVGDLLRSILFSHYAKTLPGGIDSFKKTFAPFTSCFSSETPILMIVSRLLVHCVELENNKENKDADISEKQLQIAAETLDTELDSAINEEKIATQFKKEEAIWKSFYSALDSLEFSEESKKITSILESCRISDKK